MLVTLILKLLLFFVLAAIPSAAAARFTPKSRPRLRYFLSIILFALFVTPSLAIGEMVTLPLPFGAVLMFGVALKALQNWPIWHLFAFPVTTLVATLLYRRLRPNNSFKPNPLRGSA